DILLSPQDVRALTFGRLREYQRTKNTKTKRTPAGFNGSASTLAVPDRTNHVRVTLHQLINAVVDELTATKTVVPLASNETNELLITDNIAIAFPGVEGVTQSLELLSRGLCIKSVALQLPFHDVKPSVSLVADHLMPHVKEQLRGAAGDGTSNGYVLLGYSYGGLLALEAAARLEAEGVGTEGMNQIVLLDSAPDLLRAFISEFGARHTVREAKNEILDNGKEESESERMENEALQIELLLHIMQVESPDASPSVLKICERPVSVHYVEGADHYTLPSNHQTAALVNAALEAAHTDLSKGLTGFRNSPEKMVWQAVANLQGLLYTETPIVFENVRFLRATRLPKSEGEKLELKVNVHRASGDWEVSDNGTVVACGRVRIPEDVEKEMLSPPLQQRAPRTAPADAEAKATGATRAAAPANCARPQGDRGDNDDEEEEDDDDEEECEVAEPVVGDEVADFDMGAKHVYKCMRLRGYNYQGLFRCIHSASSDGTGALIRWSNWISFLDGILQVQILAKDSTQLYVPTSIQKLDAVIGFEFSGRLSSGRRVMGMRMGGCVSSEIIAPEFLLWDVPEEMTLLEASTIPAAYGTHVKEQLRGAAGDATSNGYVLLGYSYGGLLALEAAARLEAEGVGTEGMGRLKAVSDNEEASEKESVEEEVVQLELLTHVMQTMAPEMSPMEVKKLREDLLAKKCWDARLRFFAKHSLDTGHSLDYKMVALNAIYSRLISAWRYSWPKDRPRLQASVTLIRPATSAIPPGIISEDGGLSQLCERPVSVHYVEGADHYTLPSKRQTAALVNAALEAAHKDLGSDFKANINSPDANSYHGLKSLH
ncbi:Uncharacterized protein GBIM_18680, partial [Gryllus bimaculatus]